MSKRTARIKKRIAAHAASRDLSPEDELFAILQEEIDREVTEEILAIVRGGKVYEPSPSLGAGFFVYHILRRDQFFGNDGVVEDQFYSKYDTKYILHVRGYGDRYDEFFKFCNGKIIAMEYDNWPWTTYAVHDDTVDEIAENFPDQLLDDHR